MEWQEWIVAATVAGAVILAIGWLRRMAAGEGCAACAEKHCPERRRGMRPEKGACGRKTTKEPKE